MAANDYSRDDVAQAIGCSEGHLRNCLGGSQRMSAGYLLAAEKLTGGAVTMRKIAEWQDEQCPRDDRRPARAE